jgi:hypothetical protein
MCLGYIQAVVLMFYAADSTRQVESNDFSKRCIISFGEHPAWEIRDTLLSILAPANRPNAHVLRVLDPLVPKP